MKTEYLKKILVVAVIVATATTILSIPDKNGEGFFLLEALVNNKDYMGVKKNYNSQSQSIDGIQNTIHYNNYCEMLAEIDMSRLPDLKELELSSTYYDGIVDNDRGTIDLKNDLEIYALICEILDREDINPTENEIKIQPYHIYGSWFCECRYKHTNGNYFNIYKDTLKTTDLYRGPFSMHKSVIEPQSTLNQYSTRMYSYISVTENSDISEKDRVLRIHNSEMEATDLTHIGKVNNGFGNLSNEERELYVKKYKENLKAGISRPNPEFLPDAIYTYSKRLRSVYDGLDPNTLNKDSKQSFENLEMLSRKYLTNREKFISDLYFMGAVYKNSYEIKLHTYPNDFNDKDMLHGMMPRIYFEMANNFDTLDLRDIGLYNGWLDQYKTDSMFCGVKFKGPMYNQKVTNENNLIDKLAKSNLRLFDKNSFREEVMKAQKFANQVRNAAPNEIEYSMYYPLRCITEGRLIQNGVENIIQEIYDYQLKKGIIKEQEQRFGEENGSKFLRPNRMNVDNILIGLKPRKEKATPDEVFLNGDGRIKPGSVLSRIASEEELTFPFQMNNEDKFKITHGYWCGKNENDYSYYHCEKYHKRWGQHRAMDITYYPVSNDYKAPAKTNVIAMLSGEVICKQGYNGNQYTNPLGNLIIAKTKLGDTEVYIKYPHLESFNESLKIGSKIKAGNFIGVEGTTGNSTGNHLHVEIYTIDKKGRKIKYDPFLLLPYCNIVS